MCKVRLCGLKPCDVNYKTSNNTSEMSLQQSRDSSLNTTSTSLDHGEKIATVPETDYLNLHIKPLAVPMNSVRKSLFDISYI